MTKYQRLKYHKPEIEAIVLGSALSLLESLSVRAGMEEIDLFGSSFEDIDVDNEF